MKRLLKALLCAALTVALLAGCGAKPTTAPPPAVTPTDTAAGEKAMTLMIYMIGSDLESKSGAGTKDMQEMTESGINLATSNVLVYAGGSKKWHNDLTTAEERTLLHLTENGFEKVTGMESASMGEAASLTAFLNYGYENYPASEFALILWDHGNGPLIGYGKDMLFKNDALTLLEMKEALDASPFGAEKKLAWVGFDACLMSSAELVCLWDDYASYLVASQEIEPSFGWNYGFLKDLGKTETTAFLTGITTSYLTACEEYYAKKNFDNSDATLACVDLSKAAAMETALNALFAKATTDVADKYDLLTAKRVETRALGRASTGSEYDLVDLYDMADKLKGYYPDEAAALQTAITDAVFQNATNAEGCCGISLYYPFYNKPYFERDWHAVYTALGMFSSYQSYLAAYTDVWMQSDKLDTVAQSVLPSAKETGVYALDMSDEQAAAFADARYFVFTQDGNGLYTPVFVSRNITREGNTLLANFDGSVLCAKDKFNRYILPVSWEHDTVGDRTHYSVYVTLTNAMANWFDHLDGFDHRADGHRFHLTLNNKTQEITVGALVPHDLEMSADTLMGGKAEDADLSQYSQYIFPQERHRYLTRLDSGVIAAVSEWPATSYFSGYQVPIGDELEFLMAPLGSGEYFLAYEIEDTQGNRYCSELLPIQADSAALDTEYFPDPIERAWESGDTIDLFDQENVTVSLVKTEKYGNPLYTLAVDNRNDFAVTVSADEIYVNHNLYCHDASGPLMTVPANTAATDEYGFSFGALDDLHLSADLESIQFAVTIQESVKATTLVKDQVVYLTLSEETTLPPYDAFLSEYSAFDQEVRGALAAEQSLRAHDSIAITLLGLGGNGLDTGLRGAVCLENNGDRDQVLELCGISFGNTYLPLNSNRLTLPCGAVAYETISVDEEDLDRAAVTSVGKVTLYVRFLEFDTLEGGGGFVQLKACPVSLSPSGSAPSFEEGATLL